MAFLDSKQQRAALFILVLGAGLLLALWPFVTGLIGAPVLYVVFAPVHRVLARRLPSRAAAGIVIVLALLTILGPGVSFIGLLAAEARDMASGVVNSPILDRIAMVDIGPYNVGEQLASLGQRITNWAGNAILNLVGTATRIVIQLTIAFFGLYYLLVDPERSWNMLRPFIPFSAENTEALRQRFEHITISTLIGIFATAAIQGVLVGAAFTVVGLPNAFFWGVITAIMAILPVVGSGMVWGPGAIALAIDHRIGWAIGMALWGFLVVANVDNVIRPWVFRRYAQVHPFITIIGAFAGIRFFGLLGLLIGPLAISYFFELIRMYRAEYLEGDRDVRRSGAMPRLSPVPPAAVPPPGTRPAT
jgi:predicted PurR-regulated permease PerM